jgi:hypothetical protein
MGLTGKIKSVLLFLLFSSAFLCSCKDVRNKQKREIGKLLIFNQANEENAWIEKDTEYFIKYLSYLDSNNTFSDDDFFDAIGEIPRNSNLYFGLYQVSDSSWIKLSNKQRTQEKRNLIYGYKIYFKSKLAFDSIPDSKRFLLQDWYNNYTNDTVFDMARVGDVFWLKQIDSLYR